MTIIHLVGHMIDNSRFDTTADLDTVIEALDLELAGDDNATDSFISAQFNADAGIAVNAMVYESRLFIQAAQERLRKGGRFACKGLITEFGASTNRNAAITAYKCKEF